MDWSKLGEADETTKQEVISELAYHRIDYDTATVWIELKSSSSNSISQWRSHRIWGGWIHFH